MWPRLRSLYSCFSPCFLHSNYVCLVYQQGFSVLPTWPVHSVPAKTGVLIISPKRGLRNERALMWPHFMRFITFITSHSNTRCAPTNLTSLHTWLSRKIFHDDVMKTRYHDFGKGKQSKNGYKNLLKMIKKK